MSEAILTVDVVAHSVSDDFHSVVDSENLSTPSTATELLLESNAQALRIGHYGDGDNDGPYIVVPDPPTGYLLTSATYVVIAYAEASETLVDPTEWSPDTPNPTQAPFLMIETSATGVNFTLDPIPVGAYAGETVWAGNDLAGITGDIPANRIWLQSYSDTPIHVAYAAVRLSYALPALTAAPKDLRRRFTGA